MPHREYEYVSAIAQEKTLSGAAVRVGVSQPALTRFLQKEEAELGISLFQRIDNRMELTHAGECYLDYARRIMELQSQMKAALEDIARADRGRLRLGIPIIRRPFTFFSVIPEFKRRYPNVALTISEMSSTDLEEQLEQLALDCIAVNVTRRRDCFEYIPIAKEEYVLAVHKDSPLLERAVRTGGYRYPVIRPEQLSGSAFIMLGRRNRIRQFADSVLSGSRADYTISMQSSILEGALEAVANDLGCTFTPEVPLAGIRGAENIRYLALDAPGTKYEFSLLYRRGAYIPTYTQEFMDIFVRAYQAQREQEDSDGRLQE